MILSNNYKYGLEMSLNVFWEPIDSQTLVIDKVHGSKVQVKVENADRAASSHFICDATSRSRLRITVSLSRVHWNFQNIMLQTIVNMSHPNNGFENLCLWNLIKGSYLKTRQMLVRMHPPKESAQIN